MTVFSVHTDTEDVETVLGRVGEAVRRWEAGDALPLDLALVQGRADRLVERARQLSLQQSVDGHAIIVSTRPRIGPWIIRFQHLVRRATWWFTEPVLQQIRMFQLNAARVLEGLAENQEVLLTRAAREPDSSMRDRLEALEVRLQALEDRLGTASSDEA